MQVVRRKCNKLFDCQRASLFLFDDQRRYLLSVAAEDDEVDSRFPVGSGLTGEVAGSGKSLNVNDAYQTQNFNPSIDWQVSYY